MDVEIRQSSIHGLGVFARNEIEEDHWQYIYGDETDDPPVHQQKYCFVGYGCSWFLPYRPFKYLNHSDEPNCVVVDEEGTMIITALHLILPGEELTIDYGYFPVCGSDE